MVLSDIFPPMGTQLAPEVDASDQSLGAFDQLIEVIRIDRETGFRGEYVRYAAYSRCHYRYSVGHGFQYYVRRAFVLRSQYKNVSTLLDRKRTRLNSSHLVISYAAF